MFQSTPLCEGRQLQLKELDLSEQVSIHAPVRGATVRHNQDPGQGLRFNPRPCARGDNGGIMNRDEWLVSIHAPVRGATPFFITYYKLTAY